MKRLVFAAAAMAAFAVTLPGQNCSNTSIGEVPLSDLGQGTYQGFTGGLYGNGSNVPTGAHLTLGQAKAQAVTPLDAAGNPDPGGRIVLLSIGMSNTTQEFSVWQTIANGDPNKNPAVTLVDGAQGGQDAVRIANPNAAFWTNVDQRLALAGVTPAQVQVVWLKQAIAGISDPFPASAQQLQGLLAQIAVILKSRYPNVQLCFCSSRTYAGYAVTALNPEPWAYESGFSVQWLIQQQAGGDPTLNADPAQGPVVAPWLGFGAYLWADGTTPRGDGFTWTCADVQPDGTHPSPAGRTKVANLLQAFFTTDPQTTPWYLGGGGGTNATFVVYGTGCQGTSGVPRMRSNGLPTLGNANFRLGVDRARPNALAILILGFAPDSVPFAGSCNLLVDPATSLTSIFTLTNANGAQQFGLPIPGNASLTGLELFSQWAINDPQGATYPGLAGLAASNGGRITVGT